MENQQVATQQQAPPPAQQNQPLTTKALFARTDVRQKFEEMLGKRAPQFITSVLQITASNALLAKADPTSIYQAAAVAATLDLPLNNNLGFAYIVPYGKVAQFQMGYKGFIQLAQRSGQFKTISCAPIFEGQIKEANPLTGYRFDFSVKATGSPIGYAAYFALINGFEATLYMTVEELKAHGARFSQTFKRGGGLWASDFESMARKTVIKLLLSRYAPLSVEMQRAVITDQSVVKDHTTNDVDYVDAEAEVINKEEERVRLMIQDAVSTEDMTNDLRDAAEQNGLLEVFNAKCEELGQSA